jgi:hypothetical protein
MGTAGHHQQRNGLGQWLEPQYRQLAITTRSTRFYLGFAAQHHYSSFRFAEGLQRHAIKRPALLIGDRRFRKGATELLSCNIHLAVLRRSHAKNQQRLTPLLIGIAGR